VLIDDPMAKIFAPFGEARWKIANGEAVRSREMYFAIYQPSLRTPTGRAYTVNTRQTSST
jgi:type I restriction enzyme R subunit